MNHNITTRMPVATESVAMLKTCNQGSVPVYHFIGVQVETLAKNSIVDCVVAETEDGFSDLGKMRDFVSQDLGIRQRNLMQHAFDGFPAQVSRDISGLADWNRNQPEKVTLVCIPSERDESHLKGLVLAPYAGSQCYLRFANPVHGKPNRDFVYNVTYESILYAYTNWGARRIGVTHFSSQKYAGIYHPHVARCQLNAMQNFGSQHKDVESFTFIDFTEGNRPLEIVKSIIESSGQGAHRAIKTSCNTFWGIDFVDLEW